MKTGLVLEGGGLRGVFQRPAFGDGPHVQPQLRVGQVDGAGLPVDDDVLDVAVLG